ncbi:ionotropic receptor 21a [Anopheles ziemanni]|uniref:ionotropic receptor 21a n=1 Tax=Anopheles coustani TaxID=139045 RepID=UPI002658E604|nr:ionotropic receptor 21a [Anopheles coustani]XP_058177670.1 ionotropic receptor 21a [Anopheles ziemanni]
MGQEWSLKPLVIVFVLLSRVSTFSIVRHPERFNEQLINYKGRAESGGFFELASEGYYTGAFDPIFDTNNETSSCAAQDCTPERDSELAAINRIRRRVDPTFYGNPKTREQIWERNFAHVIMDNRQTMSLVSLLNKIILKYLYSCIPIVLYDTYVGSTENYILEALFTNFPTTYITGRIGPNYTLDNPDILNPSGSQCRSYIMFLADVMMTRKVIGPQLNSYVVLIPRSSQWKLQEFLAAKQSRDIINLLVIGESYSVDKRINNEQPYVLYTHELYVDGLGANRPQVLTSWIGNKFSRNNVNLFPPKLRKGFAGHRFTVMAAHQPPYVIKRLITDGVGNVNIRWEGLEIRILRTLSMYQNFTFDIVEPSKPQLGSGDAVVDEIQRKQGDIGLAGIFVSIERNLVTDMSVSHSTDCAAFLTLMSSALPRYRAILGPFQWPVWVAIIFIYLLAIFPLAFSDKMTLRHLLGNWSEIENMFWYVFGTFTNSLTFQGENSWSNTKKASTRMLIGIYWLFTIIITACYTGSIIAFITLPVEPERVDSVQQLSRGFYRIGTLDRGGWERWFLNSSHKATNNLLKDIRYVSSVDEGVRNVTGAFLISYAFIGSKAELEFLVKSNLSHQFTNKRYGLHVSRECFALYGVSITFPPNSVHRDPINNAILYMQEVGLIKKLSRDVAWETVKTKDGRFREASVGDVLRSTAPEERGLTLADTEGMFLLMLFGYVVALGVLISEWVGGCTNKCREILKERAERLQAAAAGDDPTSVPRSTTSSAKEDTPRNGRNGGREFTLSGDTNARAARRIQLTKEHPNDVNETGSDGRSDCSSVHKRSLSECLSEVSSHTMQDLYNGPDRRHSTIVFIEGQLMSEEEAQRTVARNKGKHRHSLSSVVEREVGQMFKFLDSGSSVSGEGTSGLTHRGPRVRNDVEVMAEINARALVDTGNTLTVPRRSIEATFGEKLLH